MDTRRNFLKKSMLLSGAAGLSAFLPASVQRAFAIDPAPGTTWQDAEHVVILMQENRAFDHCFGSLQGVRGFSDPRAVTLPNGNPVWLQTDGSGKTYAPFRLDIKASKSTWMGDLPHSRASQVDANNLGHYDRWLQAKVSSNKKYSAMPLTLGYYTRQDLPFNYALADAFTVCDQHFCSAMTSTWPNRLYFWSGTVREPNVADSKAFMRNDLPYGEGNWKTFPERLEENGISWKVYQNDLSAGGGYEGEERSWLGNFGCNPLELFSAYNVRFSDRYTAGIQRRLEQLPAEIKELENRLRKTDSTNKTYKKLQSDIQKKKEILARSEEEAIKWTRENYERLSPLHKNLHEKAFATNGGDPHYREITNFTYHDGATERSLTIPKGDVLYQFRKDVDNGSLPAVSWIVGPQKFSDHPSAPWYGALYVSEVLDILTKDPEVWKKTIFILTYDENDGYYDHIPPYMPPDARDSNTGKTTKGIDTVNEYIRLENELKDGISEKAARAGAIGLGFRVPMVIASPWSRGGKVCSQIFDHTSTLQFLEKFVEKKFGKKVTEENISNWRRTICGDLTSVFSPYNGEKTERLPFIEKSPFIESIHKAQFKDEPHGFRPLTEDEIIQSRKDPRHLVIMPKQEKGVRRSCALPYEIFADANLSDDGKILSLHLRAGKEKFGDSSMGCPFRLQISEASPRHYAVEAGAELTDEVPVKEQYKFEISGPNGFYRKLVGSGNDAKLRITCTYSADGSVELDVKNNSRNKQRIVVENRYAVESFPHDINSGGSRKITVTTKKEMGWYDVIVSTANADQIYQFAGRVETGKESISDPAMGNI